MNTEKFLRESIFTHWTRNLVESPIAFVFNVSVTIVAGILYSFKIIPSGYMLLIFGIVSPVIFTLCLYDLILNSKGEINGEPVPKALSNEKWSRAIMLFDCSLIVIFALLIYFDVLNFLLFRFLQTIFFPVLLLLILKGFYFFKYQS